MWRITVSRGSEYMGSSDTMRAGDYLTRMEAETKLREEVDRAKGQGYTLVRHELRTALGYILHLTRPNREPDGTRPYVNFSLHQEIPYKGKYLHPLPENPDFRLEGS